ncbi:hypothetical protein [Virgibacillus halodenitrificans]|nr:hypothetical protein [Virgibacillus halodenitrificans]
MDIRIAYYTRKVAEYVAKHISKGHNPYRYDRLMAYKSELNRRLRK